MKFINNSWSKITSICVLILLLACNSVQQVNIPPKVLSESEIKIKAEEIHQRTLVLDTHADIALSLIHI